MSKFEICTDDDGDMIWELRTKNNQLVARGERTPKQRSILASVSDSQKW